VLLAIGLAGGGLAGAGPALAAPAPSAPAAAPSGWKQVYEDSQTIYYVGAAGAAAAGEGDAEALLAFKVPQVIDGVQVWSIVSRLKLDCPQRRVVTLDNTLYALPMATGKVIQVQDAHDDWHTPQAGSLGELVWSAGCGRS
jgi:hypothetical protein